ncbi:uncharacterized protein METZ01_LOCUS238103, partial [marine metagenome]
MLNSMTGFAHKTTETRFGFMTCELRTINHRFLDIQLRLPEELRAKEIDLRSQIGDAVKRGKVECSISLRRKFTDKNSLDLNDKLMENIATLSTKVTAFFPESKPVDPISILRWPGVITESEIGTEPLYLEALKLIHHNLAELTKMRSSEG